LNTFADDVGWFKSDPKDIIPFVGQRQGREQPRIAVVDGDQGRWADVDECGALPALLLGQQQLHVREQTGREIVAEHGDGDQRIAEDPAHRAAMNAKNGYPGAVDLTSSQQHAGYAENGTELFAQPARLRRSNPFSACFREVHRNALSWTVDCIRSRTLLCGALLCATLVGVVFVSSRPTLAYDAQTNRLQRQIDSLRAKLQALQQQVAEAKNAASTPPPVPSTKYPVVKAPGPVGVNFKVGGFVAAESVWRQKNEVAIQSDFNSGIPLPNSPLAHENEFQGRARHSRISLLATSSIAPVQHVAGYLETDFLGVGITSNSRESNSYVPRLRHAYTRHQ
jgi:hypothetical protein